MSQDWLWRADGSASDEQLARLKAICPISLPASYLSLLSEHDGAEAGLSVDPLWLVIYGTDEVIEIATSGTIGDSFPGYFVFGGNGGGELLAFDTRSDRTGEIVAFDMANTNLTESVQKVAETFDGLFALIDT